MRKALLLGCALILVAWSHPAAAQWVPVAEKKGFGQSLDATDSAVFVGDPENTYMPGQVVVYAPESNGSWSQRAVLEAQDGALDDRFGTALDAADGTLAVGAPAANAVYLFRPQDEAATWTQAARVAPSDNTAEFGTSVALAGNHLFVGATKPAPSEDEPEQHVVYVFEEQSGVGWQEMAVLQNDALAPGSRFGAALLAGNDHLIVGAPEHSGGAVTIYQQGAEGWAKQQTMAMGDLTDDAQFGTALQWAGDQILVGAPRAHSATGAAYLLARSGKTWSVETRLLPSNGVSGGGFGTTLAARENEVWIGAPNVERETGALYRFQHQGSSWSEGQRVDAPEPELGDSFGAALAMSGSTVAVGLPGDDSGAGTLALYSTTDNAWTADSPIAPPTSNPFSAMTGKDMPCSDGTVQQFSCKNVDLKAFMPVSAVGGEGGVELNDIWGWTDPKTGTEYALVGRADGTAFVDVSDPNNPVYVGELLRTEGSRVNSWRDVKVYKDHAFIVADNVGDHGMQVFDLTQLRDVDPAARPVTFEATAHYDRINSAHNVAINKETGYAYIVGGSDGGQSCGGGLHMVNIQDPLNPTFEGCFGGDRGAGSGGTGSTHDAQCLVYEGPDQEHQGQEICVAYNETEIAVVDVTDKANPQLISTASYPNYGYVHQGWFTDDQRYMYSNDEADELQGKAERTRTIVWDMTDLENPTVANQFLLSETSSDHNLYVKGDRMYQSNYKSGLRVLDISNPVKPEEVGHFDLFPPSSTPGYEGTWSNYPYFESGIIVTSTYEGGFFVLEPSKPEL